jgi:hypothetical protein
MKIQHWPVHGRRSLEDPVQWPQALQPWCSGFSPLRYFHRIAASLAARQTLAIRSPRSAFDESSPIKISTF